VKYDRSRTIQVTVTRKENRIVKWESGSLENPQEFDDPENLILNAYGKLNPFQAVADYFGSIRVYNIDAFVAKSTHNGGDAELDRSGSNLISFLKRIIESERQGEELLADLRTAVPYIGTIAPERILSLTPLRFSERDSNLQFRAQQMSDGTIRLLGLLAVLRQSPPLPVVVIEEPENALHAYAVRVLVQIAREASRHERFPTQVFFTSHSPTVVDEVLSLEGMEEVPTQAFVTMRRDGANMIKPAPPDVMRAITQNLGRPSEFLREGNFEDGPVQLELFDPSPEMA
jgi:predicted ATPase